jgi:aspartate aminotransferase
MLKLSNLADTLIPSEIIKLGNEINERIKQGATIYNFTIGDFDPSIFPIPQALEDEIVNAYRSKKTNYKEEIDKLVVVDRLNYEIMLVFYN